MLHTSSEKKCARAAIDLMLGFKGLSEFWLNENWREVRLFVDPSNMNLYNTLLISTQLYRLTNCKG